MLSIGKLANGQANYYLDLAGERVDRGSSVATGVEDYYVGGTEPPGRWTGDLASEVGLTGEVKAEALKDLLDEPASQDGLESPPPKRKVPGYDLTFSAPKSVSVVFGIAEPDVQRRVLAAHRVAVDAALAYLEREAVRVRQGKPRLGQRSGALIRRWSRGGAPGDGAARAVVQSLARSQRPHDARTRSDA
jgi:conjugative relaxase-like TrwC/TraI family protein